MVDYAATAMQAIDVVYYIIWVVLFGIVVIGLFVMLAFILPYKHKVRIRELTGDKTRIIDDKAKEIKEHGVVTKWKLRKKKHFIPIPPPEAVHLTSRGKVSVEAYFTPEGEYKYIKDQGVDDTTLTNFVPLSTVDREFYANEMQKKEKYRKKSIWDYVMPAAGFVVILGVFILMLVFWEDIAKPGIKITETAAGVAKTQKETMEMMSKITEQQMIITEQMRDAILKSQTMNPEAIQNANSNNTG